MELKNARGRGSNRGGEKEGQTQNRKEKGKGGRWMMGRMRLLMDTNYPQ